jgi:glycosyltransferase involved in cell wall biosynthesis
MNHHSQPDIPAPAVCIIAHNAYGAISGGKSGFIGGVEWQSSLLAKQLAERRYAVSFLTWAEGEPGDEIIGGVRVLKVARQNGGFSGLRFFHPKWTGLNSALRRANADVYYHNCGECVTGQVALWCARNERPFVFSAASDADFDPKLPELKTRRERVLYRYGLRRATRIVAQTGVQQRMLQQNFGLTSQVIPMPCPGPSDADYASPSVTAKRVLWVGRVCRVKRPDRILDIAAACPDVHFDVVGPIYDDQYATEFCERTKRVPNLTVHGATARDRMGDFYRRASLLCCTSEYEGFPNTFLEAWSHGLPVVSTVDPDSLISRLQLGIVATTPEALGAGVRQLLGHSSAYELCSSQARTYYVGNHTVEAVIPQFERLFTSVVRPNAANFNLATHA